MPWSSEGGNGGSWKPGGAGPWGQKPGAPPPEFEEFLKRAQEKLKQWMPGPTGTGGRGVLALVLAGAIIWLVSGFYTLGPNEVGLNRIFGRYTGKTGPGLNYNLPFPIGGVEKLPVTDRNTTNVGFAIQQDLPEESLMLTGDENIADVKFVVIWQIDPVHPENYAFNISNQRETVKAVAESAMREVIGRGQIQHNLDRRSPKDRVGCTGTHAKGLERVQSRHPGFASPIAIRSPARAGYRRLQGRDGGAAGPEPFAQRGRGLCQSGRSRGQRQGRGHCPRGGRLQAPNRRPSDRTSFRFNQIYAQYKKAPEVTRRRTLPRDDGTRAGLDGQGHYRSEWRPRPRSGCRFPAAWAATPQGGEEAANEKRGHIGGIAVIVLIVIVALASMFYGGPDRADDRRAFRRSLAPGAVFITTPGLHFKYPFIEMSFSRQSHPR